MVAGEGDLQAMRRLQIARGGHIGHGQPLLAVAQDDIAGARPVGRHLYMVRTIHLAPGRALRVRRAVGDDPRVSAIGHEGRPDGQTDDAIGDREAVHSEAGVADVRPRAVADGDCALRGGDVVVGQLPVERRDALDPAILRPRQLPQVRRRCREPIEVVGQQRLARLQFLRCGEGRSQH